MDDIKRPTQRPVTPIQPALPNTPVSQQGQAVPPPVAADTPEAAIGETPQEQKQHVVMNHKANKAKGKKGPVIAIIFAVIVTLGLIGVAVYIYMRGQTNKDSATTTETIQVTEETSTERLQVEDIDATTTEIDKQLNTINDSSDFGSNDLSDSTIGL